MQFKKDKYIYEEKVYTVEGEWLNGLPHGVCIIDSEDRRGVYTFTHGVIYGGPVWWEDKKTGSRTSREFQDRGKSKGIFRVYFGDN